MRPGTPISAAALAALVAVLTPGLFAAFPHRIAVAAELAPDNQVQAIAVAASDFGSRSVALGKGKSVVIDFPRDIKDVLVGNPRIANAVIRSSRRADVIGNEVGQTNVFFFDADGKQMVGLDIAVTRDLNGIRAAIKQVLPDSDVRVEGIGDSGVILSGLVSSQAEAQQAYDIATRLLNIGSADAVGAGSKVVNAIIVRARDQIMLKVTVAEVERDLIKQLGINLSGSFGFGSTVVNFNNNNPLTALGQSLSGSFISPTFKSITGTLQAMEQAGVIHTLAEPTLTAVSGETATFLAGGEFPILNGYSCSSVATGTSVTTCQPSIQFKKFGVSLTFTPVVLSEGRISLRVLTEVSDVSAQNALAVPIPEAPTVSPCRRSARGAPTRRSKFPPAVH